MQFRQNRDFTYLVLSYLEFEDLKQIRVADKWFNQVYTDLTFWQYMISRKYKTMQKLRPIGFNEFQYCKFIYDLEEVLFKQHFQQQPLSIREFKPPQLSYRSYIQLIKEHANIFMYIIYAKGNYKIWKKQSKKFWRLTADNLLIYSNIELLKTIYEKTNRYPQLIDLLHEVEDWKYKRGYLKLIGTLEKKHLLDLHRDIGIYRTKKIYLSPLLKIVHNHIPEHLRIIINYLKAFDLNIDQREIDSVLSIHNHRQQQKQKKVQKQQLVCLYTLLNCTYRPSLDAIDQFCDKILKRKILYSNWCYYRELL